MRWSPVFPQHSDSVGYSLTLEPIVTGKWDSGLCSVYVVETVGHACMAPMWRPGDEVTLFTHSSHL